MFLWILIEEDNQIESINRLRNIKSSQPNFMSSIECNVKEVGLSLIPTSLNIKNSFEQRLRWVITQCLGERSASSPEKNELLQLEGIRHRLRHFSTFLIQTVVYLIANNNTNPADSLFAISRMNPILVDMITGLLSYHDRMVSGKL